MNQAHYHLLFNHLPIIIPLIGLLVLIGGMVTNLEVVKKTAYLIFIFGALATIPAILTGDGAEDIVKTIPGVTKNLIHAHEHIADTFALSSYFLGLVSLIIFWLKWKREKKYNIADGLLIVYVLVVLFFAMKTGNTGGEIRHTEIRENSPAIDSLK